MKTIDIPAQTQPWSTVFAVAQHFTSDEWLLTGGLMVQAHAMLHGLPVRPTTDADFLLNILTYDRIATQMESYLATMGYRLQKDALTKYATRFENPAHDKVDILVTDYLYGKKKREGATLSGMRLCGMPGGGQAIKRSMRLQLRYDQQSASIAIPDLLGALMLSLIDSPDEEAKRLHSSNDRKRILRLHELLAADSDYWSSLDQTHRQDGIDTLDTLTDWAKGEHH